MLYLHFITGETENNSGCYIYTLIAKETESDSGCIFSGYTL